MTPNQYALLVVMLAAVLVGVGLALVMLHRSAYRSKHQNLLVNHDNQKLFGYHETAKQLLTLATASARDAAQAAVAMGKKADDAAVAARLVADDLAAAGGPVPVVALASKEGDHVTGVVVSPHACDEEKSS